jgi:hypothetical protein
MLADVPLAVVGFTYDSLVIHVCEHALELGEQGVGLSGSQTVELAKNLKGGFGDLPNWLVLSEYLYRGRVAFEPIYQFAMGERAVKVEVCLEEAVLDNKANVLLGWERAAHHCGVAENEAAEDYAHLAEVDLA